MVDFQSRDTRRGLGDDEDEQDEAGADDEATTEESNSASNAETEPESATESDGETASDEAADSATDRSDSPTEPTPEAGVEPTDGTGTDDPLDPSSGSTASQDDQRRDADGDDDHDHGDGDTHDHHAHDPESVSVAVVTVSSTRTLADDTAGDAIAMGLDVADHEVATREVVPDDYDEIQEDLGTLVDHRSVDAVVTTGGTGVTPDDVTVEAARAMFDKELPGFGELFRLLSYDEIGSRTVATRATAGVISGVPVFCLPGSQAAVELGVEEIIAPEVAHLVGLASRE